MVSMHLYAPEMEVMATAIEETMQSGEQGSHEITINNNGPGRLMFEVGCQMFKESQPILLKAALTSIPIGTRAADGDKSDATEPFFAKVDKGLGGPDAFGYSWIDSDQPDGPAYNWVDISGLGTAVSLGDDGAVGPLAIGFDFPFYENSYNEIYIGSNGLITFGAGSTSRLNVNLPDSGTPNNLIAMWWDDLDPGEGGNVYYYYDAIGNRFVVSFVNIQNYITGGGTGSLTFQAILYPNGQVVLQYATMDPGSDVDGLTGATIGIENADGTDGLNAVCNAAYVHDNLAVSFRAARWMTVTPASGTVEPYSSTILTVGLNTTDMESGTYTGQIMISGNDPMTPSASVPVTLTVQSFVCGDANSDGDVNVADAVILINYVFKSGPPPDPLTSGDANGDGDVNVADAVYLINFVFSSGPDPIC
jgi:hypothetical protein